mmetsp:Transcript_10437/g.18400  ORF Transcript_10437/g.18400 Transcript_10437/m.18400 type:complete len:114 (+) Transcript_10437:473-814(+)
MGRDLMASCDADMALLAGLANTCGLRPSVLPDTADNLSMPKTVTTRHITFYLCSRKEIKQYWLKNYVLLKMNPGECEHEAIQVEPNSLLKRGLQLWAWTRGLTKCLSLFITLS